jgi:hypothetical protein
MKTLPHTLAPRSGERVGARRKAAGRVRGTCPTPRFLSLQSSSLNHRELTAYMPLTLPLLRNGSLPLPAARGEGKERR